MAAIATEIVVSGGNRHYLQLYNTDTTKPVNALVDWGDGTTTEATGGTIYHEYDMTGERTIKVYPYSADKLMITDVSGRATSVNVNTGIKYVQMQDVQSALTKATFADGVETIQGFNLCDNLADVTIPDSVNRIYYNYDSVQFAFSGTPYWDACTSNGLVVMGRVAVTATGDGQITIPSGVWYINECFNGDYQVSLGTHNITSLSLPSGLKTIGRSAFVGAASDTSFTSVAIPASVTNIGEAAFYRNSNLASVTFANGSVLDIGENAFSKCKITSVTFSATVTSIGANAFEWNRLTNITIPATVTSIGTDAFANNSTLTEIHFAGSTPPATTGAIIDTEPYIYVPVGAVPAYEAAGFTNVHEEGWQPPHDISLTWETGAINPTTGANSTDSNAERSSSTSNLSEVLAVKWVGPSGAVTSYKLMVCCYNKSDGTYAGTYNGTSVVQGESWLHANDYSSNAWNDDLSGLTAYDFRFVIKGKWGSAAGQGQRVVVYGIE